MLKEYKKEFTIKQASIIGAEVTPEMLTRINQYALKELKTEEVYVRKFLLAHNAIDRDNERFPETILDQFRDTLSGKSLLIGHDRRGPGKGLFFDNVTEEITKEAFKELTGEEAKLPEGIDIVKVLWSWFYMLNAPFNEEIIANIDAGIYRHGSIGYRAADLVSIKKDPNGPPLYWEYVPPGEATEGSIVWLGAQPGATAQKMPDEDKEKQEINTNQQKGGNMEELKKFLKSLSQKLGKVFSEENAIDEIKELFDGKKTEMDALIKKVDEKDATITEKDKTISDLTPLAEDGKAYRKELVDSYVTLRTKLEEIPADDETKQKQAREIAESFPVDFLKSEAETLRKRVDEKFPDNGQLNTDDPNKKRTETKENKLKPQDA